MERKLEEYGILIKSAKEFYPKKWLEENSLKNFNCVRLCISGVPEEHINAIGKIISVVESYKI
ncbi:hypothetical protein [Caloramator australicus]|uniref:Uncharacterized protein n=1 Tax=Caloramator australicus RC3 TaxID=857293 RepID=G0V3G7_9CLOT|nr:hypothetical protein [Caloramator australicus]CCC57657.1 hypothetical protein CAAU_0007 [Caloramator australicus RC3]